ncbi:MAG: DUF2225 domain-containing protein [Clostridia bacterium]|nr:DUF2225 domain-containing protein [Clostridia bacterium]
MDSNLYNKAVACPVCSKETEVTKVKAKASKVLTRDSDFCVHYEGINPLFYDIWVCEHCGYAAQSEKFEQISTKDVNVVKQTIGKLWHQRKFSGERSVDKAIETFKLALYNLQVRKAKSSELARICMRIAWLYRMKNDAKEKEFLNFALRCYSETYESERFPVDKLDENTCMYIIGELNRRVGNYNDATKWFSRLISSPDARKNPTLLETAREQFQLTKEAMEKSGDIA